ncbi:MAG: hypothetical protein JSR77_08375 [Planctomycetes bacterium]|nr:hypothetical protein [Planctomycetota bacterium]
MNQLALYAASPSGGRSAAATELAKAIIAHEFMLGDAMDLANKRLDDVGTGQVKSFDATAFAGAVLDAAAQLEPKLPQQGEMEIFWINVGRLAFRSAEEAHAAGRVPEAMTLVLAGPRRWQNDAYWNRYSDHDGLTSLLMAKMGQRSEAIARLQNRPDLRDVALQVYEMLTKGS